VNRQKPSLSDVRLKDAGRSLMFILSSELLVLFLLPYFYPAFAWKSAVINIIILLLINIPAVYLLMRRNTKQTDNTGKSALKEDSLSADVIAMCEEALRETETRFHALFNESRDAVYIRAKDGRFLDFNQSMQDLFGYSREEMLRMNIADLYANATEQDRFQKAIEETGSVRNFEVRCRGKDGKEIDCLVASSVRRDREGNNAGYHGIIHDITERKKLEQQLLQAQKMEAVGRLAGGIAHDFNNILTAIIGYAHLLKLEMPKDDQLDGYVMQIIESSERAANLTRALLAFSRKQVMSPKPLNINTVIQGMKGLLFRLIGEDVELTIRLSERDLTIMADTTQMEQVLMNLVTNARDAMPDGGNLIITTQHIKFDAEFAKAHGYSAVGDFAMISVEDTGHGIDVKIKESIFDPFFSTKEVGKGTGLGLAMAYGIVKQHKGYINVYSDVGKGTTFKIYLPLTTSWTDDGEGAKPPVIQGGAETILIAEDDVQVRTLTRKVLENAGYHVLEAPDGSAAVSVFRENRDAIRLMLLDVIMPKMNGNECFHEIRKIKADVKIIFMSGYTADIIQKKGILTGEPDLILKPVSPNDLLRRVREALDGHTPTDPAPTTAQS
jgi:PAS domain S-box-containing protein